MSSSPKLAAISPRFGSSSTEVQFEPFPYDAIPSQSPPCHLEEAATGLPNSSRAAADPLTNAGQREAQIRQQGVEQGKQEARKRFDEQLLKERAQVAATLARFSEERSEYFEKVEGEVVALALSIARKVLHRESQIDPCLLAGMVRVALEKLEGATQVTVRVHPSRAAAWKQSLQAQFQSGEMPQVVEDTAQLPDGCVLQSPLGTTSLGIESQLKEIEQGLFDLLAARPRVSS